MNLFILIHNDLVGFLPNFKILYMRLCYIGQYARTINGLKPETNIPEHRYSIFVLGLKQVTHDRVCNLHVVHYGNVTKEYNRLHCQISLSRRILNGFHDAVGYNV